MTDHNTIPADKVRELIEYFEGKAIGIESYGILGRFRALLPTPPQPTTGLLGRWAKHDAYGDVVVISDYSSYNGKVWVSYTDNDEPDGASTDHVPFDSLMFPEQATKPEDVPAGEAWLVDVEHSKESHKSIVALKYACDDWRTSDGVTNCSFWEDTEVTLISPLTPERPGKETEK